ncbi:MAG: hypothetical protein J6B81_02330 [Spirochaetaceae bacterium]|nr:hypothetical protein [Spirochaetaceae bacterium]
MKNKIFITCIFLLVFVITSCFEKNKTIQLEPTPDLALGLQWAVVIEPYAMFRDNPSLTANTQTHGRSGDILQVVGKNIILENKKQVIWYLFEKGWLPETSVKVYSTRSKAETAALEL